MNKGKIVQVMGPVVDVEFDEKQELPSIKDALLVDNNGKTCVMEVSQHIGNHTVRCIMLSSSEGLHRDMEVTATGAGIQVPVGNKTLGRLFNVLGETIDGGEDLKNEPHWIIPVSYTHLVFQNYALYPHMTVYEKMAFALKLRKLPKAVIDQKVKEAAGILGLEDLLRRKPKALSGCQRQRVAMGRAIVRNPKVFLMDEPLSNLDAKLRVQMRAEISKLHQRLGA